jgi:hypothetical protein
MIKNNLKACVPKFNLIKNIGFGPNATHTKLMIKQPRLYSGNFQALNCDEIFNSSDNLYDIRIINYNAITELKYLIFKKIKNLFYRAKRLFSSSNLKSNNWKQIEYFDDKWNERTYTLQKLFPKIYIKYIYDLGCGTQFLRKLIFQNEINYIPVDYTLRSSDTIVCDFNSGEFPEFIFENSLAFMSGLFEYIIDVYSFLSKLKNFEHICLSYCSTNFYPDINVRKSYGWKNHFSVEEILEIFQKNGYALISKDLINNNSLFYFKKKS